MLFLCKLRLLDVSTSANSNCKEPYDENAYRVSGWELRQSVKDSVSIRTMHVIKDATLNYFPICKAMFIFSVDKPPTILFRYTNGSIVQDTVGNLVFLEIKWQKIRVHYICMDFL